MSTTLATSPTPSETTPTDTTPTDTTPVDTRTSAIDTRSSSTTTATTATTGHLSDGDVEALGAEIDAIRTEVMDDLGDDDAAYIHRVIAVQRGLEAGGRGLLLFSLLPPAWLGGTAALSVAKILENMEIGHNVLHGQWDWLNDPEIHSSTWEWDSASSAEGWKYSHNYIHHTYTRRRSRRCGPRPGPGAAAASRPGAGRASGLRGRLRGPGPGRGRLPRPRWAPAPRATRRCAATGPAVPRRGGRS